MFVDTSEGGRRYHEIRKDRGKEWVRVYCAHRRVLPVRGKRVGIRSANTSGILVIVSVVVIGCVQWLVVGTRVVRIIRSIDVGRT